MHIRTIESCNQTCHSCIHTRLLVCLLELIGVDLECVDHHGEDANLGKDHLVLGTVADQSQQEVEDQGQRLRVAARYTAT